MRYFDRKPILLLAAVFALASLPLVVSATGETPVPPASGAGAAQTTVAPQSGVLLKSEFKPGETLRYAFEGRSRVTARFHPRMKRPEPSPERSYRLRGQVVVQFAAEMTGDILEGTLRYEGLEIEDWVSETRVTELRALFREVEAAPVTLRLRGREEVALGGGKEVTEGHLYFNDWLTLNEIARQPFLSWEEELLARPGERRELKRESATPAGAPQASEHVTMTTEYLANVALGERPGGVFRVNIHYPPEPVAAKQEKQWSTKSVLEVTLNLTLLRDLKAQRLLWWRAAGHTQARLIGRDENPDAPVRIPLTLLKVDTEREYTVRFLPEPAPPRWEADLAAFEKSLEAEQAAEAAAAATPVSPALTAESVAQAPTGEPSLGEAARQLRQQKQAQAAGVSRPQLEAQGLVALPPGFSPYTFPGANFTVVVPVESEMISSPEEYGRDRAVFRAKYEGESFMVSLQFNRWESGQAPAGAAALEQAERNWYFREVKGNLRQQDTTITGYPARLRHFEIPPRGHPHYEWMAALVAGPQRSIVVNCWDTKEDFSKIEPACRVILGSIRVQ